MNSRKKYLFPVADIFRPVVCFLAFITTLMVQAIIEPFSSVRIGAILLLNAGLMVLLLIISLYGDLTARNALVFVRVWWMVSTIAILVTTDSDWTEKFFVLIEILLLEVCLLIPDVREKDLSFFKQKVEGSTFEFSILVWGIPSTSKKVKLRWAELSNDAKKGIIVSFEAFESETFVLVGMQKDQFDELFGTAYIYMVYETAPEREIFGATVPSVVAELLCTYLPMVDGKSKEKK